MCEVPLSLPIQKKNKRKKKHMIITKTNYYKSRRERRYSALKTSITNSLVTCIADKARIELFMILLPLSLEYSPSKSQGRKSA